MTSTIRKITGKIAAGLISAGLLSSPAFAQDSGGWTFNTSIYGWLPSLDTTQDTRFGRLEASVSGSDVISALDFAFMGTLEARKGRWGFVGDLIYTDLSASNDTPGDVFGEARIGTKLTAFTGLALYRAYESPQAAIDLGGGFRAFDVKSNFALTSGRADGFNLDGSTSAVVPLVSARLLAPLSDRWFATAFFDYGVNGSDDETSQAFGSVGYFFNEKWSMQVGYRFMNVGTTLNGRNLNLDMSGPLIGVTARF
jgi:hypothetical protein